MPDTSSLQSSVTRFGAAVVALVLVLLAVAVYAFHERNLANQSAAQNDALASDLKTTHDQVNGLTARVDALSSLQPADNSAAHPAFYQGPMTAASMRHRIDDPRWKKMQGQLDDQRKQIDLTRQDLTNTRTELQGSIATTHDELVLLAKKGERSYYEFDLNKSGKFQAEGPVGVRLRKANSKRDYADLEMLVDDFKVSKKHVNIYEPVVFYSATSKRRVELVINNIGKNHIHGYVSEPKYKSDDMEANASTSTSNPAASNPPASNPAASANGALTDSQAKPSPAQQQAEPPSKN